MRINIQASMLHQASYYRMITTIMATHNFLLKFFLPCMPWILLAGPLEANDTTTHKPLLTWENSTYTLFDSRRKEHVFYQNKEGQLMARDSSSGTLIPLADNRYRWLRNSGLQYQFQGSRMESAECAPTDSFPSEQSESTSEDGSASSPAEQSESTSEDGSASSPAEQAEQNSNSDSDSDSDSDSEQTPLEEEQCDTTTHGAHTFMPIQYEGPHTSIDARPASCKSFFVEYYGTQRGMKIEAGLNLHSPYRGMTSTIRTFPIIDFMNSHSLYVSHSRDLGNRTFNSPNKPDALLNQLLDDGQQIQERFVDVLHTEGSISASELGQSTTITLEQLRPITMQLIIRDGMASSAHWLQIDVARRLLMERHGITLEIIIIP